MWLGELTNLDEDELFFEDDDDMNREKRALKRIEKELSSSKRKEIKAEIARIDRMVNAGSISAIKNINGLGAITGYAHVPMINAGFSEEHLNAFISGRMDVMPIVTATKVYGGYANNINPDRTYVSAARAIAAGKASLRGKKAAAEGKIKWGKSYREAADAKHKRLNEFRKKVWQNLLDSADYHVTIPYNVWHYSTPLRNWSVSSGSWIYENVIASGSWDITIGNLMDVPDDIFDDSYTDGYTTADALERLYKNSYMDKYIGFIWEGRFYSIKR